MPRFSSRARSLLVRTELRSRRTPPHLHLGTSFHPRRRSGECTPRCPCPLCLGPLATVAPQQASPELLGSQEPPALSQKVPFPVMPLVVHRVVTPGVVACSEVPADQWAVSRCCCVRCSECEPSIN
jgi:hypothetical protein